LGNYHLGAQMRKTNLITEMPPTLSLIDAAGEIGLVCSTQNARRFGYPFSGNELQRGFKSRIVM
jgi:hypothetical protein